MPIYLKIQGMEGDVSAKGHEKWIEVSCMNFNVSRNINTKPGAVSDRESTRPSISEIEISKTIDKTSPHLFSEACVGKSKLVNLDICRTGETLSAYVQYTLSNAIISYYGIIISSDTHGLQPTEKIRINFDKIEMKVIPFDAKHNPGSPIPAGYDLAGAHKI